MPTVSRTQYQFVLENPDPAAFNAWVPKLIDAAAAGAGTGRRRERPAADRGCRAYLVIDRATAARFGITPATVDNALYDAFGQRIVSTIFTQSNQYRVILEADPALQQSLAGAVGRSICRPSTATTGQVPLSAIVKVSSSAPPLQINASRPVPGDHDLVQPRARRFARRGGDGDPDRRSTTSACRTSFITAFQGAAPALPGIAVATSCC